MNRTLKVLEAGPKGRESLSAAQVAELSKDRPADYRRAIYGLCKDMLQQQFKGPHTDTVTRYESFVSSLRSTITDPVSDYFFGTIDAYRTAITAGLMSLDWESQREASNVGGKLLDLLPPLETTEGLAWRVLLGQVQSVYSRDEASVTFQQVRSHPEADLVQKFYRDTGALTYYSEAEVAERRRTFPPLAELRSHSSVKQTRNLQAVVISVDPYFFRIYGPMIMFNAQQAPEVDFVVTICGTGSQVDLVERDARDYLAGLSALNRQRSPRNLRIEGVHVPEWVRTRKTFYAAARFVVLPGLLEEYEQLYAMDADMFLLRHPREFMNRTKDVPFGATSSNGPVSISPWRRIMAGTLIVNRTALEGPMLQRTLDYISVGLTERYSWMLDQNALTYAVEAEHDYQALQSARPAVIGTFMAKWEQNFRSAIN